MNGYWKKMAMAVVTAAALGACGGSGGGNGIVAARSTSARIGAAGGTIRTPAGVTLVIPAGALQAEMEIQVNEPERHEGDPRHIELEPHGTPMAAPMSVTVESEDGNAADERLVEIEHQGQTEVEHLITGEHAVEVEHAREVEINDLAELEMREARACVPACDTGLECDDGTCKPHGGSGTGL